MILVKLLVFFTFLKLLLKSHKTPTSDTHKSESNISTNKSFHWQTGTYPDSSQKIFQTDIPIINNFSEGSK